MIVRGCGSYRHHQLTETVIQHWHYSTAEADSHSQFSQQFVWCSIGGGKEAHHDWGGAKAITSSTFT